MELKKDDVLILAFATALVGLLAYRVVYFVGYDAGRQECPMAVVPKCDFVFRGDKLIKTICPDSTGAMP